MAEESHRTPRKVRQPTSDKARVRAEVQRGDAVQLRLAGATYTQIAQRLGVSRSYGYYLVSTALARTRARTEESATEMLALDLGRLDALLLGIWQTAVAGNLLAIDRVLKILERRARLLGLDAPTKVAPTSPDGAVAWQPEQASEDFYDEVLQILAEHGGLNLHRNGSEPETD
jgi:hypothetical protein